jgi:hypothetical protein
VTPPAKHDDVAVLISSENVAHATGELIMSEAPTRRTRRLPALPSMAELTRTTPGKLTLLGLLLAAGAVCFLFVASVSARSRLTATHAVLNQTEPLLVQAVALDHALTQANATATSTFLIGGLEPPASRAAYGRDIQQATAALTALTRQPGARANVAVIASNLPTYTGLVEAARANNRQLLPVGAAYMRAASTLLTEKMLPAANNLFRIGAQRLESDYSSGTSTRTLIAFIVEVLLVIALFAYVLWRVARATRRILNVPILIGTLLLAGLAVWGVVALSGDRSSLVTAQRSGSDQLEASAAAQILLSRAQTDDSLTLIARGGDQPDPADWQAAMGALQPGSGGGLIGELRTVAARTGSTGTVDQIAAALSGYAAQHRQVGSLISQGDVTGAIKLALADQSARQVPANRAQAGLGAIVVAARNRFHRAAADASSSLSGLALAIPVVTLIALVLALVGLGRRIQEYL